MSLKGIKLVTFDATNTLLKFKLPPWNYYAMAACEHGFQVSADSLKKPLKDSFKQMWDQHPNFGKTTMTWEEWWRKVVKLTFKGYIPSSANTDAIADKLIDEFGTSRCWCLAEGSDKLISLIKKQGITVGVISNFDPRLKEILHGVGLYKIFDIVISSYDIGFSKPDVKIFEAALNICNDQVKPTEALHIGDDVTNDYQGAKAAGWHALLINPSSTSEMPPAKEHVFESLHHLTTSIQKKNTLKL